MWPLAVQLRPSSLPQHAVLGTLTMQSDWVKVALAKQGVAFLEAMPTTYIILVNPCIK